MTPGTPEHPWIRLSIYRSKGYISCRYINGEGMQEEPKSFLPVKIPVSESDTAILSPVYLFGANVMLRGIFFGVKLIPVTAAVDAASGRTWLIEGTAEVADDLSLPCACRRLDAKLSRTTAAALADEAAVPDCARGWRRGITSAKVIARPAEERFVWHVYILRGNQLIDGFSGASADASGLIGFLLGQSNEPA
ncbi:MAG: hypothetical protein IKT09_04340 [Synergistes sp.]|nr:hypothetical protein [Synergistes sp.]